MIVTCRFAIYPLRTGALGPAIDAAMSATRAHGLVIETDAMSSTVTGRAETVFEALRDGFLAAASGDCVLVATVSNTCPQESRG
ncbi:MAG TPA: YkoF family thiamine/hydroxymethylpyrimidine-binding protein [Actinomycetota bacterium]|nr:YkoF family thiamine/hydroxymethylpyrimidine-binding protein [Actinomycetota bacterium]